MGEFWRKIEGRIRRRRLDEELLEEMRTHLEMKAAAGADPEAARRQFGNLTSLAEQSREAWGWPAIEEWLRDFRMAARTLGRKRGFAAAVVATLGIGIGSSSAIFSLIDTVLLRPLPYPDADRLASIQEGRPGDTHAWTPVSPARLEDLQRMSSAFDAIAGSSSDTVSDTSEGTPERLPAAFVSPRFFAAIGTQPALGRPFTPEEERFGGPGAVILSDSLWRRRFAADQGVVGRRLTLENRTFTIAGVMPPKFSYPSPETEVWAPTQASPKLLALREARIYQCIGRLKKGLTIEEARADLAVVQSFLGRQYPKTDGGWTVAVESLKERVAGGFRTSMWLLFASVSVLLLTSCANVACLLLARLNSRAAEIATRRALGAGRAALGRQLLAEGLVYALAGGLAGTVVAILLLDQLREQLAGFPRIEELAPDFRMILAAAGISVAAAVLFSLAPILQTLKGDGAATAIRGGRGTTGSRQRLPRLLVSAQMALATALLAGAGLFLRSLELLEETPPGFDAGRVLTLRVSANSSENPAATVSRHQRMLDTLARLPGIEAAAMATGLPGVNPPWPREFRIAGEPADGAELRFAGWRLVTADYFRAAGIPILSGRTCRMSADPRVPFEALVNRRFAERYFPGGDPIGHDILNGPQGDAAARIVGITANSREGGVRLEAQPVIYGCGFLRFWPDSALVVRTQNPSGMAGAARAALIRLDPSRPLYAVRPLSAALRTALAPSRFRTLVVSLFSMLCLMLASVGLYGVMAYMVSQRTREFGVRAALGARPAQILWEILRMGGGLAAAGAAAGTVLAAAAARWMGELLYPVAATEWRAYALATGILGIAAILACLIPGRRATSIDPTEALRAQ